MIVIDDRRCRCSRSIVDGDITWTFDIFGRAQRRQILGGGAIMIALLLLLHWLFPLAAGRTAAGALAIVIAVVWPIAGVGVQQRRTLRVDERRLQYRLLLFGVPLLRRSWRLVQPRISLERVRDSRRIGRGLLLVLRSDGRLFWLQHFSLHDRTPAALIEAQVRKDLGEQ